MPRRARARAETRAHWRKQELDAPMPASLIRFADASDRRDGSRQRTSARDDRERCGDPSGRGIIGHSLLGSSTVLRVLATAYYRLTRKTDERDRPVTPEMTHDEVIAYFEELAPFMKLPITKTSPWLKTGVFPDPGDGEVKARRVPVRRRSSSWPIWAPTGRWTKTSTRGRWAKRR